MYITTLFHLFKKIKSKKSSNMGCLIKNKFHILLSYLKKTPNAGSIKGNTLIMKIELSII